MFQTHDRCRVQWQDGALWWRKVAILGQIRLISRFNVQADRYCFKSQNERSGTIHKEYGIAVINRGAIQKRGFTVLCGIGCESINIKKEKGIVMGRNQKRGKRRFMAMVCPECRENIDVAMQVYKEGDKTVLQVDPQWACPKCAMAFEFVFETQPIKDSDIMKFYKNLAEGKITKEDAEAYKKEITYALKNGLIKVDL